MNKKVLLPLTEAQIEKQRVCRHKEQEVNKEGKVFHQHCLLCQKTIEKWQYSKNGRTVEWVE